MALDYSKLQNIPPLEVNISRLGAGEEIPENIRNYTRDTVGTDWLPITSFGLFLFLFAYYHIKLKYTTSQSLVMSSLWCSVVSFGFLVTGFSKNIYPLIFYGTVAVFSWMWMYQNKKKGLEG